MEVEGLVVMEEEVVTVEFIEVWILRHLITTMIQLIFKLQVRHLENADLRIKMATEEAAVVAAPRFPNRNVIRSRTKPQDGSAAPWTSPRATARPARFTNKSAVTSPVAVVARLVSTNVTRSREEFPG